MRRNTRVQEQQYRPRISTMKSAIARRRHVDLTQAIAAFYDPNTPTRDAVVLWRKAMRRADKETKELLLSMVREFQKRENDGAS
jgi:hypothetical protein